MIDEALTPTSSFHAAKATIDSVGAWLFLDLVVS